MQEQLESLISSSFCEILSRDEPLRDSSESQLSMPGSFGSFSLRVGQVLFSVASLLFMTIRLEFCRYTAFCYVVTTMGLVVPWSMAMAAMDGYFLCAGYPFRHPGIMAITIAGDWVLSILSLAAACATAGITDFLLDTDVQQCATKLCTRYQLSATMAFMSWFLTASSSLLNLWSLVSW